VPALIKDLHAAVRDQPCELGCVRHRGQRILLPPTRRTSARRFCGCAWRDPWRESARRTSPCNPSPTSARRPRRWRLLALPDVSRRSGADPRGRRWCCCVVEGLADEVSRTKHGEDDLFAIAVPTVTFTRPRRSRQATSLWSPWPTGGAPRRYPRRCPRLIRTMRSAPSRVERNAPGARRCGGGMRRRRACLRPRCARRRREHEEGPSDASVASRIGSGPTASDTVPALHGTRARGLT
jgi:hypothetical protein